MVEQGDAGPSRRLLEQDQPVAEAQPVKEERTEVQRPDPSLLSQKYNLSDFRNIQEIRQVVDVGSRVAIDQGRTAGTVERINPSSREGRYHLQVRTDAGEAKDQIKAFRLIMKTED